MKRCDSSDVVRHVTELLASLSIKYFNRQNKWIKNVNKMLNK